MMRCSGGGAEGDNHEPLLPPAPQQLEQGVENVGGEELSRQEDMRHDFPLLYIEFPTPRTTRRTRTTTASFRASTYCNDVDADAMNIQLPNDGDDDDNDEDDINQNRTIEHDGDDDDMTLCMEDDNTYSSLDTNHIDHRQHNYMIQQRQYQQRALVVTGGGNREGGAPPPIVGGTTTASSPPLPQPIVVEDVSRQELDAMKRMVQDMIRNPDLLHSSPIYTRSVANMANYYPTSTRSAGVGAPFRRGAVGIAAPAASATMTTKTGLSYSLQRRRTSLSSMTGMPTSDDDDELELLRLRRNRMLVPSSTDRNRNAVAAALLSRSLLGGTSTTTDVAPNDYDDVPTTPFTPTTPNNNDNKSSRCVSQELCHECYNSSTLTMSAPQPAYRTQRVERGTVEMQLMEHQWGRRALQSQQIQQLGEQKLQQRLELGIQIPHIQDGTQEQQGNNHIRRRQSLLSSVTSPTDEMDLVLLSAEGGKGGEEDATMDISNNNSNHNNCRQNDPRPIFPPMPFAPK